MLNELTRIIEEGNIFINSKFCFDNCYVINNNWQKKWYIYYNNSIKYNYTREMYLPGNIAKLIYAIIILLQMTQKKNIL